MKQILLTAFALAFALTALQAQEPKTKVKDDKVKMKSGDDKVKIKADEDKMKMKTEGAMMMTDLPYKAGYSSQFVMANPAHARIVQDVWKDWDDNMLDRHASHFADSIVMEFPNGMVVRGKDSMLMMAKQYRGSYATVKSEVEAWMSTRSTDRNEDWVLIWGIENRTTPDGKKEKDMLHEIWNINKDGKIAFMRQYANKPAQQ